MFSVSISRGDRTRCKEGLKLLREVRRSRVTGNYLGTHAASSPSIFSPHLLVHKRHRALRLAAEDPREELQRQAHVDGHEDIRGVDHHGDGGEEDGVEDGFFPRLQDIDAGDEQVLVVQPGQVLCKVLEGHRASWAEEKWRWRVVRVKM